MVMGAASQTPNGQSGNNLCDRIKYYRGETL